MKIFKALIPPLILIISVLGSILAGLATPTESAGVGALGSLEDLKKLTTCGFIMKTFI